MRVLTYNVLSRDHADGARREKVLRAGIAELRPDVVALQEVTRSEEFDQAREVLGPGFTIVDHPSEPPDAVGACLASRWPLGEVHSLDLHLTADAVDLPWAGAVAVEVQAPEPLGTVLVVHHKPNWQLTSEYLRERQAVAAARWIEDLVADRPGLPVVLLGDFDADAHAASIRFWTGRQSLDEFSVRYDDAWEACHPGETGHTFSPRDPLVTQGEMKLERGRRIDYIMVRSGPHGPLLDVEDCRIVFDEQVDGVWVSDHFGLLADLVRPTREVGAWG